MAEHLVIVESPAKARTIAKYLGRKYKVKASVGHVRDLPKSQFGVDVENDFTPKYITIRGKGEIVKELKDAAKKADKVFLATDPDREGEAISWHLAQVLGIPAQETYRVTFNEITKKAVQAAFKNPRPVSQDLVNAQQARRILDRIVGYRLSPLLWKKVKKGLSAGRVQSVAVRLIADRESEIQNFRPEEYWSLVAHLQTAEGVGFMADFYGRAGEKLALANREAVDEILSSVKDGDFIVENVKQTERRRNPAPPFTTSTLQQEASRRLGFTAKKTMRLAQTLYEGVTLGKEGAVGLITYMRTDSTRIAPEAMEEAKGVLMEMFGESFVNSRSYGGNRRAQDAHEAVRPTAAARLPDSLKGFLGRDELRLYRLIWERFLSSQMAAAVYDTVLAEIGAAGYIFRANGSRLKFRGFLALHQDSKDDKAKDKDRLLPPLAVKQKLLLEKLAEKQHFTEPPPRYNEAALVKALEELGIGRPSTYATIIDTIQSRGYVVREDKRFHPTELGQVVIELLKEYFARILDVEFTASLESQLDLVEDGQVDWIALLKEFYEPFEEELLVAEKEIQAVTLEPVESDVVCELCGRKMVYKTGRFGQFLACPGFPECRNTKPLIRETGAICPKCGNKVVERRSKKGRLFYGCLGFPDCDFVTWNKPVPAKVCPQCDGLLVEKYDGKQKIHSCINEECRHEERVE